MGYANEFILWAAKKSQLLAHQLLWNMQTNLYLDEDSKVKDPALYDQLSYLINKVINCRSFCRSPTDDDEKNVRVPVTDCESADGTGQTILRARIRLLPSANGRVGSDQALPQRTSSQGGLSKGAQRGRAAERLLPSFESRGRHHRHRLQQRHADAEVSYCLLFIIFCRICIESNYKQPCTRARWGSL